MESGTGALSSSHRKTTTATIAMAAVQAIFLASVLIAETEIGRERKRGSARRSRSLYFSRR